MSDLVVLHSDVPMVDSVLVGKKFKKDHRQILDAIRRVESESSEFWRANFCASTYRVRGKDYENYLMTRDGFSLIAMGFTGKDALQWKVSYINAFNAMEKQLVTYNDSMEWKQARVQIKEVRKSFTDTVKEFVEYATKQGSKSANMYYCNITKMEYAALELVEKGQKAPSDFRNTLDLMDLSFLTTAEQIARAALLDGMNRDFPYKEVYKLAKDKVNEYAKTVSFARLKLSPNRA